MNDFDWTNEYKAGAEACRAGEQYDAEQTEAWRTGFGDAVVIAVADEVA